MDKNNNKIEKLIEKIEDSNESNEWRTLARDKFSSLIFKITILAIFVTFIILILTSFNENNVHKEQVGRQTNSVTNTQ